MPTTQVKRVFCKTGLCIVKADHPKRRICHGYDPWLDAKEPSCSHCRQSEQILPDGSLTEDQKGMIIEVRGSC